MVAGIEKRLFEGDAKKGKTPKYSLNDLDNELFKALALHITTKRIPMLQQLRVGLERYDLIKVMQKKPQECHDLFVIGYDDKVDSHYILSHLAPEMSPIGSIKQVKESKIMEFFQDFLLELEDTQPEDAAAGENLSVPKIMQWMTGQAHTHLLVSEREKFNIVFKFDHCCLQHMPNHTVCYPIVSACTNTITFPVVHMVDYESFKTLMQTAVTYGASFDRV
uniref:HECT domain-containing protein n=1 Tax=Cyprinus carpio carpio TaxID=630221 RepID=A0A8C1DQE0_CYPCA